MLSLIIPTHNEATRVGNLIENLLALPGPKREVLVSDGGSRDDTVEIARQSGALVIEGARGRGAQLNAGAHAARGEILWFVHADAQPHPKSLLYLASCAANSKLCGGNFRLRFRGEGCAPHLFARIARQQRRFGLYYGDSGIWVRRPIFDALNGFENWPLFEDYDFARRLENYARGHQRKTALAPLPIHVSARRFEKAPLGTLFLWLKLQILFSLGVSPHKLAQMYRTK